MDEKILLTPKEAKKLLGVGTNKIYEIFAEEDFPVIIFGRKKFVRRDALFEWMRNRGWPSQKENHKTNLHRPRPGDHPLVGCGL